MMNENLISTQAAQAKHHCFDPNSQSAPTAFVLFHRDSCCCCCFNSYEHILFLKAKFVFTVVSVLINSSSTLMPKCNHHFLHMEDGFDTQHS